MNKRILVVDDDEKHLQTTRDLLEFEGFEVVTHSSPFRTSEIVRKTRPALILLDVNMPGLSGERLCSLLRANGSEQPTPAIFFHSSNDEDTLRTAVLRHGANGYVCKGDIAGLRRVARQTVGS